MALITEDHLEQQCLEWFKELGYAYAFAPDLAPDGTTPERTDFRQVILTGRLRSALQRLNPGVPASTIESALLQLANPPEALRHLLPAQGALASEGREHRGGLLDSHRSGSPAGTGGSQQLAQLGIHNLGAVRRHPGSPMGQTPEF